MTFEDEIGFKPRTVIGIAAAVLVLIFGVVFMKMASFEAVPPDKIMLHYTGGPIDGTHFQEIVQPGTGASFYGLMENLYFLPATQQAYIVDKDPATGAKKDVSDSLIGVSSDNVTFTFEAAVYFKVNQNVDAIRSFFEQICLHDHCYTDDGFKKMEAQYFRPQLENAVRLEAGKYTREQLYRDPTTLVQMQTDISAALNDRITAAIGGEFFCGPDSTATSCPNLTVVIKNPTPPDNVAAAYNDTAAASQAVVTAQNNAKAKVAAATGEKDAQDERAKSAPLTQAQIDYINAQALLACANNTNCTLVITQGGTGVNVNVDSATTGG